MREPFTLQVSHLCQEMFFFILPRILKAVDIQILKTIFFFWKNQTSFVLVLKIPENVSNAKFKRCAIVHVELYKVCKKNQLFSLFIAAAVFLNF